MWLMVTFSSQLTTSSLYKLVVHRAIFLPYIMSSELARNIIVWTPDPSGRVRKCLGNNHAQKCLERWNAGVGVDEGKKALQPTSVRVLLMTLDRQEVNIR